MFVLITSTLLGRPLQRRQLCAASSSMCGAPGDGLDTTRTADAGDAARDSAQFSTGSGPHRFIGIIMAVAFILLALLVWAIFARRRLRQWWTSNRPSRSNTRDIEHGIKQIDWEGLPVESRRRDNRKSGWESQHVAINVSKPERVVLFKEDSTQKSWDLSCSQKDNGTRQVDGRRSNP